jgi:hypothetical protein
MWQRLETELDKDGGKKRSPVVFLIALAGLFTAGFFTVNHFNKPATAFAHTKTILPTTANMDIKQKNKIALSQLPLIVSAGDASNSVSSNSNDASLPVPIKQTERQLLHNSKHLSVSIIPAEFNTGADEDKTAGIIADSDLPSGDIQLEKITVDADLIAATNHNQPTTTIKPLLKNINITTQPPAYKKEMAKTGKITIEVVGGSDFLRMNRKAGFYAGVRINKLIDKGTVVSAGVNYTSHIVRDYYRLYNKPAQQRIADAQLSSVNMIRVPVYFQRQMGNSKFALMAGLIPSYIIHAEVYNVPNSFVGNPDPYRKFTLADIHRFNVLFGAGLKYSPTKWMALELSGSYGLTGMVKDGYKNQSRVNDNFKSIQIGAAFRLK